MKFDGCAVWDPRHPLLEAKGPGYVAVINAGERYGFIDSVRKGPQGQSDRQATAARGRPVDWHYAEDGAGKFFDDTVGPRRRLPCTTHPPDDARSAADVCQ